MGLVLKHVVRTKAGTLHYRRRFPKDVSAVLHKGEFKRLLGSTEREALRNYPKVHAEFEQLVADARRPAVSPLKPKTALGVHRAAEKRAAELAQEAVYVGGRAVPGSDPEAADIMRDIYLSSLPVDPETGDPVGGDAVEGRAFGILTSGGQLSRPSPTLEDARKLYLKEKVGDDNKKRLELDRVFKLIHDALQRDRTLASLRREDAKEVRDHMRDGRKASSVDRYLNVVRAVINHAIREFDLNGVTNPFINLEAAPGEQGAPDRNARRPYSEAEVKAVTARIKDHASTELWLIWQMLESTGCRLAEITGLRAEDVHLDHAIPHITVEWHDDRRIKNKVSRRNVPLMGRALEAAKEAVALARARTMMFATYGRTGGPDAASAAIGKHVRTVVTDPKIGPAHSLRHLMKDRLRLARTSKVDQDLLLGHAAGSVGEDYGGDEVRLRIVERALKAALEASGG